MKKLKVVVSLCVMMLLLSGCKMKVEYDMTIKNNKSMNFSIITALDNELIDGMLSMENGNGEQSSFTDEQRWEVLENDLNDSEDGENPEDYGFSVSKYEEGEYKGYQFTKKIDNIDEISGDVANFELSNYQNISDSIVFVKNGETYKANFVLSSEEQSSSTQGYDIGIEMKYVVTLPNKPISHNATEVSKDGKTLTWNLLNADSQNIEFEFTLKDNTMLYIGIAAGVVIIFIILIVVIVSNGKKRKGGNTGSTVVEQEPIIENKPSFLEPTQSSVEQTVIPEEPVIEPEVVETAPQPVWSTETVVEPQAVPVQPTVQQPQAAPVQPTAQQPQAAPMQPTMQQPQTQPTQEMPSVADIMGLTNNNQ